MRPTRQRFVNPTAVGWAGDTPYFLVINQGSTYGPIEESWIIDVDERGWMSDFDEPWAIETDRGLVSGITHVSGLVRVEGEWLLVAKRDHLTLAGQPVMAMRVLPGEQPYFTRKHIGIAYPLGGELTVHGIGKKRLDGHVDRLWVLPGGIIVPGDDAEVIASRILRGS